MLKRYTRISIAINEFNFYIITIILIFIQQVANLHYESNYIHFIIIIIKKIKNDTYLQYYFYTFMSVIITFIMS